MNTNSRSSKQTHECWEVHYNDIATRFEDYAHALHFYNKIVDKTKACLCYHVSTDWL